MRTPFVALVLCAGAGGLAGQELRVEKACPRDVICVPMSISAERTHVRALGAEDGEGYTIFAIRVRGALGDASVASHELRVRGYTGGIGCSAFGQATAAVLGLGADDTPIIQTHRGPLRVVDSVLEVGCRDCARIREASTDSTGVTRRIPSWDLTLVGARDDSVAVSDDGALLFRYHGRWFDISSAGPFRSVPPPPTFAQRRYQLELQTGACT